MQLLHQEIIVFAQAQGLPNVPVGLRIKENKEVYEGEVTELTPEETENQVSTPICYPETHRTVLTCIYCTC